MKTYENSLELSDEHVMWEFHNENLSDRDAEFVYDVLVADCEREFKRIYGRNIHFMGRSGRHVCVSNDPSNRMNYCRMKRTVARQIRRVIEAFNSAKEVTDINKYLVTCSVE